MLFLKDCFRPHPATMSDPSRFAGCDFFRASASSVAVAGFSDSARASNSSAGAPATRTAHRPPLRFDPDLIEELQKEVLPPLSPSSQFPEAQTKTGKAESEKRQSVRFWSYEFWYWWCSQLIGAVVSGSSMVRTSSTGQ